MIERPEELVADISGRDRRACGWRSRQPADKLDRHEVGLLAAVEHGARFVLNRGGFDESRRCRRRPVGCTPTTPRGGPPSDHVLLHGLGSAATAFGPVLSRHASSRASLGGAGLPGHGFSGRATVRLTHQRPVRGGPRGARYAGDRADGAGGELARRRAGSPLRLGAARASRRAGARFAGRGPNERERMG